MIEARVQAVRSSVIIPREQAVSDQHCPLLSFHFRISTTDSSTLGETYRKKVPENLDAHRVNLSEIMPERQNGGLVKIAHI